MLELSPKEIVDKHILWGISNLIHKISKWEDIFEETYELWKVSDYDSAEEQLSSEGYELVEYNPGCWALFAEGNEYNIDNALCEQEDKESAIREGLDDLLNDHIDEYNHEVYEHWIVSNWLMNKLEQEGEHVVEFYGLNIFCRCATGQALYLDNWALEIAKSTGWVPKHDLDFGE